MKYLKYYFATLGVILVDQAVKMLVHFNMELGTAGEIDVAGNWFKLHYLLNPGMAFGMQLNWEWGKLLLTLFRLLATIGIGYYIYVLINKRVAKGFIWCMALVLGGAIGNLIDSIFYGVWLENAVYGAPTPWFHGQVVDMLYFPLYEGFLPDWVPLWGGEYFIFFRPVFNIADSAIFIGVVSILLLQKRFFGDNFNPKEEELQEGKAVENRKLAENS